MNCAQETFAGVDAEVRAIIDRCHEDSINILKENREKLDEIAAYLLKKETITGGELKAILEGTDPALAENFGANPDPVAIDTTGMEPPARHIYRESGVTPPPVKDEGSNKEE
jgi:cell division protease FtsH